MEDEYIENEVKMGRLTLQQRVNELDKLNKINEITLEEQSKLLSEIPDQLDRKEDQYKNSMLDIDMVEKMLDHLEKSLLPQMDQTVSKLESRVDKLYQQN